MAYLVLLQTISQSQFYLHNAFFSRLSYLRHPLINSHIHTALQAETFYLFKLRKQQTHFCKTKSIIKLRQRLLGFQTLLSFFFLLHLGGYFLQKGFVFPPTTIINFQCMSDYLTSLTAKMASLISFVNLQFWSLVPFKDFFGTFNLSLFPCMYIYEMLPSLDYFCILLSFLIGRKQMRFHRVFFCLTYTASEPNLSAVSKL